MKRRCLRVRTRAGFTGEKEATTGSGSPSATEGPLGEAFLPPFQTGAPREWQPRWSVCLASFWRESSAVATKTSKHAKRLDAVAASFRETDRESARPAGMIRFPDFRRIARAGARSRAPVPGAMSDPTAWTASGSRPERDGTTRCTRASKWARKCSMDLRLQRETRRRRSGEACHEYTLDRKESRCVPGQGRGGECQNRRMRSVWPPMQLTVRDSLGGGRAVATQWTDFRIVR